MHPHELATKLAAIENVPRTILRSLSARSALRVCLYLAQRWPRAWDGGGGVGGGIGQGLSLLFRQRINQYIVTVLCAVSPPCLYLSTPWSSQRLWDHA
jgi:hypothetical protein